MAIGAVFVGVTSCYSQVEFEAAGPVTWILLERKVMIFLQYTGHVSSAARKTREEGYSD